jgi:hypothetical protein
MICDVRMYEKKRFKFTDLDSHQVCNCFKLKAEIKNKLFCFNLI